MKIHFIINYHTELKLKNILIIKFFIHLSYTINYIARRLYIN